MNAHLSKQNVTRIS